MYEIFVNNKSIVLTSIEQTNVGENNKNVKYFPLKKEITIEFLISEINKEEVDKIYLYHPKEEKLLKKFKKKVTTIKAGGGIVTNAKGEILFIKRQGKWDLPKGKKEKGENIVVCALREVEEETGVKKLKIIRFNTITYHIFKHDGAYFMKETYWYDMFTKYKGKLKPQTEEDIEKVRWKALSEIPELLNNSYRSIQKIFEGIGENKE
ncbi:NUDIX hydrolase [Capnocytophaga canis]|uniref:NUDIX hydrolase n=1 Tax=Capnocytophaga canis TaxID=1848903 RepID=A0A3A1YJ38_9FLAO|nr:NUDIX domain-containing protein [Capnocytophaga canis]RIY37279.1 NUDIX hydrolase [Capnocytophaga canis]